MSQPLRVLIVEDNPDDADLLVLHLQRGGYDVVSECVETADTMAAALERPWDLVLSDHSMPRFSATAALELLRRHDPDIPFIVISGTVGEEAAVAAMRRGVSDYILKGHLVRLLPAVEREMAGLESRREWRKAEQDVRRLAAIVEGSDDAIVGKTLAGVVTNWNPGAERLYGWTADEMVGTTVTRVIPPDRAEELPAVLGRLSRGEGVGHLETVRLRKDGTRVDVSVTYSPVRDAEGRTVGVSAIARDITGRKRADAELRVRDQAIQAVTQGIIITDPNRPDNPVVYASPAFEKVTGYAVADVLGRNCRFLQGKDTDPATRDQLSEAVRQGRACSVEILNYTKDGHAFWNEISISPVRNAAGKLIHFVGVQTDVTQRRRLEEQFRQAQKMDAVGQLAGGVAHDFNNLLCVINGYSELLMKRTPTDHPTYKLLKEIHTAGERSASLTRQLLAFSRKQLVVPKVLDLNAVIADTEKMLRRLIGEDVRLAASPGEPASIRGDEGQIQQVLMNLAVNARDAMPRGGRLTVETRNVELDREYAEAHAGVEPGAYVVLTVSDTGCGMPPEVQARIFEPFFTTKRVGQGTGLGLAVVHGIVQQAGGHVEVSSEVGVGTTFKIYWPRLEPTERAGKPDSVMKVLPRGTETVLLVEDDDGVRVLARQMLEDFGYTVLEAAGGAEAPRVVSRHVGPIHLLLTDVVMPGLSGRQVAEGLAPIHPEARVLFMSGYADDAVVRHGVLQERVHFLSKPFSPAALASKVREVLDLPAPAWA